VAPAPVWALALAGEKREREQALARVMPLASRRRLPGQEE